MWNTAARAWFFAYRLLFLLLAGYTLPRLLLQYTTGWTPHIFLIRSDNHVSPPLHLGEITETGVDLVIVVETPKKTRSSIDGLVDDFAGCAVRHF